MKETNIPRRASVIDVLAAAERALHQSEIASRLEVAPRHLPALGRVLDDLVLDGSITPMPGHKFKLKHSAREGSPARPGDRGVVEGFLNANPRGFGFVAALEGAGDIYVPREAIGGALHRDKVRV